MPDITRYFKVKLPTHSCNPRWRIVVMCEQFKYDFATNTTVEL